MNRETKSRGYTLVEAMVSAALITVGIVALLGAYHTISRNQSVSVQSETMQRLAADKYEELVATQALQTQALNGDFSDRGENNYLWQAAVGNTGTNNLSTLTVTVTPRDSSDNAKMSLNGVVYQAAQTSTAGSGGTTG